MTSSKLWHSLMAYCCHSHPFKSREVFCETKQHLNKRSMHGLGPCLMKCRSTLHCTLIHSTRDTDLTLRLLRKQVGAKIKSRIHVHVRGT